MPQMTPGQARQIDPILTSVARGWRNDQFVGQALFPVVPVEQRGGRVIQFGKEDFKLYATGRAPGTNTKRVQYGYQGDPYALEQHALEGLVPFEHLEEANAVPGIDLATVAIRKTQNIIDLRLEKARADLARDEARYDNNHKVTLSGTDQWTHADSDPTGDVTDAVEAVRASIGRDANTVIIPAKAFKPLRQHPKIVERFKYTGRDSITAAMLASLWDVERVFVARAVYADDADALADVWGGDVIVAYTEVGTLADMGLPSYGYTYQLRNYPIVESPYQERNAKSWIYPVTDEVEPVLAGADAGFLIRDAA